MFAPLFLWHIRPTVAPNERGGGIKDQKIKNVDSFLIDDWPGRKSGVAVVGRVGIIGGETAGEWERVKEKGKTCAGRPLNERAVSHGVL
jgi:hypothetical protein